MSLKSLSNKLIVLITLLNGTAFGMALDLPLAKIEQINALNQNGGNCGYHALYNGICISNGSNLDEQQQRRYCESPKSPWLIETVIYRQKLLAQYYLHDFLLTKLKNAHYIKVNRGEDHTFKLNLRDGYIYLRPIVDDLDGIASEHFALAEIVINVASRLADLYATEEENTSISYTITPENIAVEFLSEVLRRSEGSVEGVELYSDISLDKIISCLPNLEIIRFSIARDNLIRATSGTIVHVMDWRERKPVAKSTNLPGEWLNSRELGKLIEFEQERKDSLIQNNNVSFHILDEEYAHIIENEDSFRDLTRNLQTPSSSVKAVLLVYLSQHWVAIVVDKEENIKPYFKIADSLNINRIQNARILAVLSKLIDREIPCVTTTSAPQVSKDLPPLELLAEAETLLYFRTLAARIRKGQYPNKGLLFVGPHGTGKFSIALNLSHLSQCTIAVIQASDLAMGKLITQNASSYEQFLNSIDNDENNQHKSIMNNIKNLFKTLQCYPKLILFVYNFEELVNDNNHEFLVAFIREFARFKRFINNAIYIIGSTSDTNLYANVNVQRIMNAVIINLPSHKQILKILRHYCNQNNIEPIRGDIGDNIATACSGYSGADLKRPSARCGYVYERRHSK